MSFPDTSRHQESCLIRIKQEKSKHSTSGVSSEYIVRVVFSVAVMRHLKMNENLSNSAWVPRFKYELCNMRHDSHCEKLQA